MCFTHKFIAFFVVNLKFQAKPGYICLENIEDPNQLASEKPAD